MIGYSILLSISELWSAHRNEATTGGKRGATYDFGRYVSESWLTHSEARSRWGVPCCHVIRDKRYKGSVQPKDMDIAFDAATTLGALTIASASVRNKQLQQDRQVGFYQMMRRVLIPARSEPCLVVLCPVRRDHNFVNAPGHLLRFYHSCCDGFRFTHWRCACVFACAWHV